MSSCWQASKKRREGFPRFFFFPLVSLVGEFSNPRDLLPFPGSLARSKTRIAEAHNSARNELALGARAV